MSPHAEVREEAIETNLTPQLDTGALLPDESKEPWSPHVVVRKLPKNQQVVPPNPNLKSPVAFFHMLERLKTTKREGWRRLGIDRGESIADHMYRMAIMTMLAPPSLSSRINVPHCTKMALVHDMAEALVGDITPVDGVSKGEKSRRELATMEYLSGDLLGNVDGGSEGQGLIEIWQEYEASETLESKFVHDVDKMELILQMLEYERNHEGRMDLGEFSWVARKIMLPEVKAWCSEVLAERNIYWEGMNKTPSKAYGFEPEREAMMEEYYQNNSNGTT